MEIDKVQWNNTKRETLRAGRGRYNPESIAKLENALNTKKIIFLAVPAFVYMEWVPKLCHILSLHYNTIGYVSLIWSIDVVHRTFLEFEQKTGEKLNENKFYFIESNESADPKKSETVKNEGLLKKTFGIFSSDKTSQTDIVRMTTNPQDMAKEIYIKISNKNCDAVIIDTISTIGEYYGDNVYALKFAHSIINNMRSSGKTFLIPFPIEKNSMVLGRDLQMFSDTMVILK